MRERLILKNASPSVWLFGSISLTLFMWVYLFSSSVRLVSVISITSICLGVGAIESRSLPSAELPSALPVDTGCVTAIWSFNGKDVVFSINASSFATWTTSFLNINLKTIEMMFGHLQCKCVNFYREVLLLLIYYIFVFCDSNVTSSNYVVICI